MKLWDQDVTLQSPMSEADAKGLIAIAASTCYNSNIVYEKRDEFITKLFNKGHLSPFEHVNITARIRTDIATYKALTRHRFCSFTIESTHFIDYDGFELIRIPDVSDKDMHEMFDDYEETYALAHARWGKLVSRGMLPQSQAAYMSMTTNLREWYQVFKLRKGKENTPNMYILMAMLMHAFEIQYPFFMDLFYKAHC